MSTLGKVIIFLSCLLFVDGIEAADDIETVYERFSECWMSGDHEGVLLEGTKILRFLDPPEELVLGTMDYDTTFFYDIGMALIGLSRWEEAKYCFTRCIIGNNSDTALRKTLGRSFAREKWFKANRLEKQPFWIEAGLD